MALQPGSVLGVAVSICAIVLGCKALELSRNQTFRNCSFLENSKLPRSCLDKFHFESRTLELLPDNMCKFSIDEKTRYDIFNRVKERKNVMTFHLRFPQYTETNCIQVEDVFDYSAWTWSYFGESGLLPILTGPLDYDIMSLGLLTIHRSVITINITVNNPTCFLVLGVEETNLEVTRILYDAVTNNGSISKDDNDAFDDIKTQSRFCYPTYSYSIMHQSSLYYMIHFTNMLLSDDQFTSYNCCDPMRKGDCQFEIKITVWMHVIQWLSYATVMVSPLLVLSMTSTEGSRLISRDNENQYRLIDGDNDRNMSDLYEDEWISVNPFSVKRALQRCWSFGGQNLCWTRLKRAFICLVIIPSQIYIRFIVYVIEKYDPFNRRDKADIALGVFSMMFGFKRSLYNWKCFMGGPFVLYSICFTLGVFLICLPENLPDMLTNGAFEERKYHQISSPLMIDLRLLERFSSIPCSSYRGQALLYRIFSARLHVLLNCKFWTYCINLCYRRFLCHLAYFINRKGEPIIFRIMFYCAVPPFLIATIVVIVVEFILLFLCHFFSLLYLCWLSYIQYLRYLKKTIAGVNSRVCLVISENWLFRLVFATVFFLICLIVFYGYIRLMISLLSYITRTLDYVLLGVIVNAGDVINYFLIGIVMFIYVWKSMSAFFTDYEDLLQTVISISHSLHVKFARIETKIHVDNNTLCIDSEQYLGPFNKIKINGVLAVLQNIQDDVNQLRDLRRMPNPDIFRTIGGVSAIRKDLFIFVVEKHCPVRNHLFSAFVKILCTCLFSIMFLNAVITFHRENYVDKILQIAAILLTGGIPILLNVFTSSTEQASKQIRYQQDIMQTVVTYWQSSRDRDRDTVQLNEFA